MRRKLYALAVLASAVALPRVAAADVIDDFTLVGDGLTITFSEPASGVIPDYPALDWLGDSLNATVNNVAGYEGSVTILGAGSGINIPSFYLIFDTPVPGANVSEIDFYGALITSFVTIPIANPTYLYPNNLLVTINPGTYTETAFSIENTFFMYPEDLFTVTITQEATIPTGVTPEPGTLLLLSSGLAGGWGVMRRRLGRCNAERTGPSPCRSRNAELWE